MASARPRKLTRQEYKVRSSELREALVQMQLELKHAPFKVMLVIAGPEGAGRGQLLGDRAANALRRPGNQGGLAFQAHLMSPGVV